MSWRILTLILSCCFWGCVPQNALLTDSTASPPINQSEVKASWSRDVYETPFQKMVRNVSNTYRALIVKNEDASVQELQRKSRCIAVIPSIVGAAAIISGAHGHGLVTCRSEGGTWSVPAAIAFRSSGVGIQAGIKLSDLVMFFLTEKAESNLRRGTFLFGSDFTLYSGRFGKHLEATYPGVVIIPRISGVYAGFSFKGSSVRNDPERMQSYFGKDFSYEAVLDGRLGNDFTSDAAPFLDLLR